MKALLYGIIGVIGLGVLAACPFDSTLRAYLDAHFWLPFSKHPMNFERRGVRRISAPFAGMMKASGDSALDRLRDAYQAIPQPQPYEDSSTSFDPAPARAALAAARAGRSLSAKDREEVDLIDAKIDMRLGTVAQAEPLRGAKAKLETFLKTARTPQFLSEARGWLARVDYLLGDRTAAGKIYLDELNRNGSNLSRETLLTSLRMNYGYDGGADLLAHLDQYFDTPEHAAFAIQMATNPHWPGYLFGDARPPEPDPATAAYPRIQQLLEQHRGLLESNTGASSLALLSMRMALRMGDPPGALKVAEMIPANAAIRTEPDFQWMLGSAAFLSHDYAAAERPLVALFQSARASRAQKAAAAYGLMGVYRELHNPVEEIHYTVSTPAPTKDDLDSYDYPAEGNEDMSVYWAPSGWDEDLLLDAEAPVDALKEYVSKYPNGPKSPLVKYSLAVRLAREKQYDEAAEVYQSIGVTARAGRMRTLARLSGEANRTDLEPAQLLEAKYKLAEYIASNQEKLYFNDRLWNGLQRYALTADREGRLAGDEHRAAVDVERRLKDQQEERWQAYLMLRDVIRDSGKNELGRKAAGLALHCLRGIRTDRFGREDEIREADVELSRRLMER